MPITPLPEPPSRADAANFAQRGDAFMAALPTYVAEFNALQVDVTNKQEAASTAATTATNKAGEAASSASAALASKNAAATSQGNAAGSASAAASSASAALASKNAAATSEANAAASAASVDPQNLSTDHFGPTEPAITWPGMTWGDSSVEPNLLRRRNAENTAWVTLGLLFDFFYSRNSVVGTVGETGGIPTGALVEYGSNTNGEFWRYAGGMQVCSGPSVILGAFSTPRGNVHITAQAPATLPTPFIDAEAWNLQVYCQTSTAFWVNAQKSGNWGVNIRGISGSPDTSSATAGYIAVGRWR